MLEHPDITRTRLTGYPEPEPTPEECEHCSDETFSFLQFDDMKFCSRHCLVEWLIKNNYVEGGVVS